MAFIALLLYWVLQIYLIILIVRMLLSWVPLLAPSFQPKGIILILFEAIYTLTDPPIKFLRRFLPPLNLGSISLDLAFLVLFFIVILLQNLVVGWARLLA